MYIKGSTVRFDACDKLFVKKFGLIDAANMVLDFSSVHDIPFVYDVWQLGAYLGESPRFLWPIVKRADDMYKTSQMPKKDGGIRKLCAPNSRLKSIQHNILKKFLNKMPVSNYATAYIKGKTLIDNAKPHTNKKFILKMDISDFFGSIHFEQVYNAAFNTTLFPKQIGFMLTSLCCRKDVLPQGAPTSPTLSNIVMKRFDDYIGNWCLKRGIAYTRYCDDMTFSSNKPLYNVYVKVKKTLEDMGFELNCKKTHFVTAGSRQSVTGLTVNQKVSVSKDYKRTLRQEIYYSLKYGLAESIMNGDKTDFVKNNAPDTTAYYHNLVGRINYVLQIEPDNDYFREALHKLRTGKILAQI